MVTLFDVVTGKAIGEISEAQLQFLIDNLEEEDTEDMDYFLDAETIAFLDEQGADTDLIELLKEALGNRDSLDIAYERD